MLFDLEKSDLGEWFPFQKSRVDEKGKVIFEDPKPTDPGKVRVRSPMPFSRERLAKRKKKFEFVLNTESRAMERVGYYDDLSQKEAEAERGDLWDYIITGWEGFVDSKTMKEIECTRENKSLLMKNPMFDRFIGQALQLLAAGKAQEEETQEKN